MRRRGESHGGDEPAQKGRQLTDEKASTIRAVFTLAFTNL